MFVDAAPVSPRGLAPTAAPAPAGARWWARLRPYLYLMPAVAGLVVWTYRPLAQTVEWSFYDWNLLPTTPATWVGMQNYADVAALPEMRQAVVNTGWYVLGMLPFAVVVPMVVALLSRGVGGRARTVYQALVFLPMLVTPVASAAVWRWMLNQDGIVNRALAVVGADPGNWFRNAPTALIALILITGWQISGFAVLVFAAGLAGIDREYVQAAALDGASRVRTLCTITLPLLSPTVLFMTLMTVLLSAQWSFALIDLLTQGGPSGTTMNIYYLLYKFGFTNFDVGYASAASVVFFAAFGVLAAGLLALVRRFSFYDN
ncbi:carbohydrate ABC transporter permease [Pseudonocardia kunmingensis]|uniref:Carbohydrate ABC transporter membrane protein 1 (CUT1 family) n=1 Tax=Pseudonocardia kunmingensis TaxID=630975 RepID=A0A543DQD8_9PSEU|nr:sugar ABC transporter permease [Pseudonocardia kunmingensis]TQM11562.1 carbohydrate ABC transporter membrane protein 1 (CUT1 family) [Pseudonocardia kunmingensis]